MPAAPKNLRTFVGIFILNALLAYPILFQIYKHFNPALTPMDIPAYMAMVEEGPRAADSPYRYRFIPPVLVRAMRPLPGYDIPVAFSEDPVVKKDFFHFLCLDFFTTVAVSGLLFLYLRPPFGPWPAYLGSLLYLFSFYSVITNLIPMTDAACHLAIIGCILLLERNRPVWFAAACLVGVFTKETLLIVLGLWILLRALRDRRAVLYLVYMLPGAIAYLALTRLFPSEAHFDYYHPGFLIGNLLKAFEPGQYDIHLIFQVFLAQLPLLAALGAFAYLKASERARDLSLDLELALFPFLIWLGITMGIGNNAGRIAFMAFPALIGFEVKVIAAMVGSKV